MDKKGIFISQVGQQPAAVAVSAAALARAEKIDRVLLLATDATRSHAQRLKSFLEKTWPTLSCTLLPLNAAHDAPAFAAIIRRQVEAEPELRFYLNMSAGYSFFWANVSRRLQGLSSAWPVFAERERLYLVGTDISWPLQDLGLEELLCLHALSGKWTEAEKGGPVEGFRLLGAQGEDLGLTAELAFERFGHLYVLIDGVEDLEAARRIQTYDRGRKEWTGLRPQLTAVTRNPQVFRRLNTAGIDVIRLGHAGEVGEKRLRQWQKGVPFRPGRSLPVPAGQVRRPSNEPYAGAGGAGAPLLVCLGNDPSATLAALYSQRPAKAWVLYDETTPVVCFLAGKMAECAGDLPVGEIRFVPLSKGFLGKGITHALPGDIGAAPGAILANVTPGTKPQSWMFGQLSGVRLCSINTRTNPPRVETFDEGEKISYAVDPGPGAVLGRILGGGGARPRLVEGDLRERTGFLTAVARGISLFSDDQGNFHLARRGRPARSQVDPGTGIRLKAAWQEGKLAIELSTKSTSIKGEIDAPVDDTGKISGMWLEEVTAAAFLAAGGRDLAVGMEWPWDPTRQGGKHRTETDVVFSWQNTHVVVSVKADPLRKKPREVEEKSDEIRAMARECFGRFSLPVLVYYAPRSMANEDAVIESFAADGVLRIPATMLVRSDRLRTILDRAMLQLRK